MSLKQFPITWEQMHRDAKILAHKIKDKFQFKTIVAITRGGLVPAAIIAKELEIDLIDTICLVKHKNQANLLVEQAIKTVENYDEGLLIVDDIINTGNTAKLIRSLYPKAYFVALYTKPCGLDLVDDFTTQIDQDAWVIFPWEKSG